MEGNLKPGLGGTVSMNACIPTHKPKLWIRDMPHTPADIKGAMSQRASSDTMTSKNAVCPMAIQDATTSYSCIKYKSIKSNSKRRQLYCRNRAMIQKTMMIMITTQGDDYMSTVVSFDNSSDPIILYRSGSITMNSNKSM